MRVMKFGGSSVANADRMNNVYNIVTNETDKKIVVLSACHGVTNALEEMAQLAKEGKSILVDERVNAITTLHEHIIRDTIPDIEMQKQAIQILLDNVILLSDMLKGITFLGELTPAMLDNVCAFGEQFSTLIFHQICINRGQKVKLIPAQKLIITNSNYNNAEPLPATYSKNTRQIIEDTFANDINIIITQGFIGADKKGKTTTLGRGGSDLTASLLGALLEVDAIEIWTDVDGVLSTDPRICSNAKTIETMSFTAIKDLAFWGAKVLHPKTIFPAIHKKIPVKILNSLNPTNKGTTILSQNFITNKMQLYSVIGKNNYKLAISSKKNIRGDNSLISYNSNGKYLKIFEEDKIFSGINSNAVSVICIAGENLNTSPIKILEFLQKGLLEGVDVLTILYGLSTTSILLIINELDIHPIIKKIHNLLINWE